MERKVLQVFFFIGMFDLALSQSVRYSSFCSVPLCASNTNTNCSASTPCYSYQTSTNQIICAPKVDCSLLDACTVNGQCASNTSICIVNSCCCQPICMPLSTASGCLTNNSANIIQNNTTTYSSSTSSQTTTASSSPTTSSSTLTTRTTTDSAASLLYGVQLNFNPASLSNTWSQCYNDTYNVFMNSTLVSTIISVCNKGKLMLGCRPKGNAFLSVSAMGLRADVLYNCSTSYNCTKVANGVGWYFSYDYSWGFVNDTDAVQRNQCDTNAMNPTYRLCWHTLSFSGGFRCGNNTWLNSDATYERVIYHSN